MSSGFSRRHSGMETIDVRKANNPRTKYPDPSVVPPGSLSTVFTIQVNWMGPCSDGHWASSRTTVFTIQVNWMGSRGSVGYNSSSPRSGSAYCRTARSGFWRDPTGSRHGMESRRSTICGRRKHSRRHGSWLGFGLRARHSGTRSSSAPLLGSRHCPNPDDDSAVTQGYVVPVVDRGSHSGVGILPAMKRPNSQAGSLRHYPRCFP